MCKVARATGAAASNAPILAKRDSTLYGYRC